MLLRVLGPLDLAGRDGSVRLAPKPRMLLAALAVRSGETCSADALIDALWGEMPPSSAAKLLQVYVSQLRRSLPPGMRISTGGAGYALEVSADEIDSRVFEQLATDGRAALRGGNPALAASVLARALELWRGPAYADARYEAFAAEEAERLERLRELTLEARLEADLRLGRHEEVLAEIRGLLAVEPTREPLARLAMLAAYRTAGPAAALAVFGTVRDALRAELGEEPGRELLDLRARISARDPTLAADPEAVDGTAPGHPLPAGPNPLVGRDRELGELLALVRRPGVRLVSLTGAGGSGKSRLALELARALAPGFANGVALVELAAIGDPELLPSALARSLRLDPGPSPMATLVDALASRETLLLLDNFEHLRAAAPMLVQLLAAAPRLVLLVTTRFVLHVSGEHVYPVTPLAEDAAVALFAERARAHDPSFELDEPARTHVRAIVRRLDGLPLPIELAAARVPTLGLRALEARLASRLGVLGAGPRDLPARQQTLREILDWSVHLLGRDERELHAGVSVFPGGFTLEAAAEVGLDGDEERAIELLGRLVNASLVVAEERDGRMRYRLFDTVREHAAERLAEGGRASEMAGRLVGWALGLAEQAEARLTGQHQAEAFAGLELEHDNLRAALGAAADGGDPERRIRLTVALSRFWYVRGHLREGRTWLEDAVADAGAVAPALRRRALTAAAAIALLQGDYAAAIGLSERSLDAARETGDERLVANGLSNLGAVALAAGDPQRARTLLEEAVALARGVGDERIAALAINNLGDLALTEGDHERARPLFEESLAILRARGDTANVARSLFNLGAVALMLDAVDEARGRFVESITLGAEAGDKEDLAWCLLGLAGVAARTGEGPRAALLMGAAVALLEGMGAAFKPFERHLHATTAEHARALAGDEAFEEAQTRGAGLRLDDAIALALDSASPP